MLFAFKRAALRSGPRIVLEDVDWRVREGEHWAVLGPNGSGKSTLLRAVLGDVAVVRGGFRTFPALTGSASAEPWNPPIGWVSYELHRRLIAREESLEAARWFSADLDGVATGGELLRELAPAAGGPSGGGQDPALEAWVRMLVGWFELKPLLSRPFRGLSTGELRRLLVARALVRRPRLLALDEPFDGLDHASCSLLSSALGRLAGSGVQLLLVSHRVEELVPQITHVLGLRGGRVLWRGPRRRALTPRNLRRLYGAAPPRVEPEAAAARPPAARSPSAALPPAAPSEVLVQMRDVRVRCGNKTVLQGLSWTMRRGERWCIRGPNGSGKSTLLALICGDHPQAYANDIRLFGQARGSGESIWDLKRRIGLLSTEFQIAYRRQASGLEVVVSGFHDSIGMYERSSPEKESSAGELLRRLGLEGLAERDFDALSGGQQRLLLLARAMVKGPELLVLDEPCQGLDPANRARVLDLIDRIVDGAGVGADLIYVSHHRDELPRCLTHLLELPEGKSSRLEAGGQGGG
jgi:molybdate transport system ATP-binding protein